LLRAIPAFLVALLILGNGEAFSDGVNFWKVDSRNDFMAGRTEGISMLADEALTLGPEVKLLSETGQPFIWSLVPDRQGNVYLGTGHDGLVLKISPAGDTTVVYDALEPEVMALAVSPDGRLYVTGSPEGRVYRLTDAGGGAENFFDPEEKYIWKLLFAPDGDLYVAVGFPGKVYRVKPDGSARVVLESGEQHIISLVLDRNGNLLAGSSGGALLYEIDRQGNVSIIFDSPLKDLRSIFVDGENNIYTAAFEMQSPAEQAQQMMMMQQQQGPAAEKPSDEQKPEGDQQGGDLKRGLIIRPTGARVPTPTISEVYFFDRDRFVTRLWRESGDAIMALGGMDDGRALFVTTKDKPSLFALDRRGELTLISSVENLEVTAFLQQDSRTLLCTVNPGKVFSIGKGYRKSGQFTSDVLKVGIPSDWGTISWVGQTPPGTSISFRTRSGNTDSPDTTWSQWSAPLKGLPGEKIDSPVRQNFQVQVTLETSDSRVSPRIDEFTVSYLRRNRPPMVSPIRFMPQGLFIKKAPSLEEPGADSKYPQEVEALLNSQNKGNTDNPFNGKKDYNRKLRMVGWNANDANGDELRFSVHYRGVDETTWRPLALGIPDNSIIFDTEPIADGTYLLRVTASDSLDNPGSRACTSERISPIFEVDNTPPVIRDLKVERSADTGPVEVTFWVEDATTRIERVELTVDAGEARVVAPVDEISDSGRESFRITLDNLKAGEHTVAIQAWDQFFNVTAARKSLTLK